MPISKAMRALGLAFACLLALSRHARAGKIIALPLCGAPSHVFIMWKVCRELADRGNKITVSSLSTSCNIVLVLLPQDGLSRPSDLLSRFQSQ